MEPIRFPPHLRTLLPEGLKVLRIVTRDRLSQFPLNLGHLDYYRFNFESLLHDDICIIQFPSTLQILRLCCPSYCRFELILNVSQLEQMELCDFCIKGPSLKSLLVYSESELEFEDFIWGERTTDKIQFKVIYW